MKASKKRLFVVGVIAVFAIGLFVGCAGPRPAAAATSVPDDLKVEIPRLPLTLASVTVGSPNAIYSAIWADIMMKNIPGLTISVEPGGMAQNMQNVHAGNAEFGLVATLIAYPGYYGMDWAEGVKYDNVRGFFPQYHYHGLFMTKADSGIKNITDLEGKVFGIGNVGSGADTTGRQMVEFFGITPRQLVNASWTDIGNMLGDGMLDAVFYLAGHPVAFLQEIELSHDMHYFELTEEQTKQFLEAYPYYATGTIPAGTYKGMPEDYHALIGFNQFICSPSLDDGLVYLMTKTLFENLQPLHEAHPDFQHTLLENVKYMNLPLHPGAERYYKDMGVELPVMPAPPK